MTQHLNSIAGALSLRPPQKRSLEILADVCSLAPPMPRLETEVAEALAAIRGAYPHVKEFERDFPSLCFALATGVGKTRLMGAFISYLYLEHGIKNFFVLAPNLTIYNKLITDFKPNTPKYVFQGVHGFAIASPLIITGDDYQYEGRHVFEDPDRCKVNIFNISKITGEVRGGKSPKIKKLSEYIGESYFDYLAKLPDLVLLMDESHRYRASAGLKAINELKPVLGLELTATPFIESGRGTAPFKNVIYDYALGKALKDGFVKEPAVVTRKNFSPTGMKPEEVERFKLEDGVRIHEQVKTELATYARNSGVPRVKPFVLVIARDTTHAAQLLAMIQGEDFFQGKYREAVIQVDSSKTGAEEEKMIEQLLNVENPENLTEIVIHVNMLKEGWDVTNLYTIVPLRAANARVLIEQSIGRGLRLPYGKRTGVKAVDRLNIIAHDKFQEIVDDAQRMDSPIQLETVVLDAVDLERQVVSVVSQSNVEARLGIGEPASATGQPSPAPAPKPLFETDAERKIGQTTYEVIQSLQTKTAEAPTLASLQTQPMQAKILAEVQRRIGSFQPTLTGAEPDMAAVVARVTQFVVKDTIEIPRIVVMPMGEVKSWFEPFKLDFTGLAYQVPSDELWVQNLRDREKEIIAVGRGGFEEKRIEDYIVAGLIDFDDVSYDDSTSDVLYDLAGQTVNYFCVVRGYGEEGTRRVLRFYQRGVADFIHAQMGPHYREDTVGYEAKVTRGYTALKASAYTANAQDTVLDFRNPPADKGKIGQYLFTGFSKCLYQFVKFQSNTERMMSMIVDSGAQKWFRPAKGQFQIFYKIAHDQREYQPDFVAETADAILMIETKSGGMVADAEVKAKRDAAVSWCKNATAYSKQHGGKPWKYLLVPHEVVAENMTLSGLVEQYTDTSKP